MNLVTDRSILPADRSPFHIRRINLTLVSIVYVRTYKNKYICTHVPIEASNVLILHSLNEFVRAQII